MTPEGIPMSFPVRAFRGQQSQVLFRMLVRSGQGGVAVLRRQLRLGPCISAGRKSIVTPLCGGEMCGGSDEGGGGGGGGNGSDGELVGDAGRRVLGSEVAVARSSSTQHQQAADFPGAVTGRWGFGTTLAPVRVASVAVQLEHARCTSHPALLPCTCMRGPRGGGTCARACPAMHRELHCIEICPSSLTPAFIACWDPGTAGTRQVPDELALNSTTHHPQNNQAFLALQRNTAQPIHQSSTAL